MLDSAPANNTVGFIGLGNMGKGMAENLVTKVRPLSVYRQIGFIWQLELYTIVFIVSHHRAMQCWLMM